MMIVLNVVGNTMHEKQSNSGLKLLASSQNCNCSLGLFTTFSLALMTMRLVTQYANIENPLPL